MVFSTIFWLAGRLEGRGGGVFDRIFQDFWEIGSESPAGRARGGLSSRGRGGAIKNEEFGI